MPEPNLTTTRTGRHTRTIPVVEPQIDFIVGDALRQAAPDGPQVRAEPQPRPAQRVACERIISAEDHNNFVLVEAEFLEGQIRTPLEIKYYADVGRTVSPYAKELSKYIAKTLRYVHNLPEPVRHEVPNATIGERMFNMIGLLMDKAEVSAQICQEWEALRVEYECHMEGQ